MAATTRLVAALIFCTLAWTVAACGDSGDGGESADSPPPATPAADSTATDETDTSAGKRPADSAGAKPSDRDGGGSTEAPDADAPDDSAPQPETGASDAEQAKTVVEGMYADLAGGDAAGVCSVLSSSAKQQVAKQVPGGATQEQAERTCVASMDKFIDAAADSGALESTRKATVGAVQVDGDVATVTVSFSGASGKMKLAKENGRWVLGPGSIAGPR